MDENKKRNEASEEQVNNPRKTKREQRPRTDDGRESSNGKVRGVEGKDYVILSSGLGIDESEVTG